MVTDVRLLGVFCTAAPQQTPGAGRTSPTTRRAQGSALAVSIALSCSFPLLWRFHLLPLQHAALRRQRPRSQQLPAPCGQFSRADLVPL